MTNPSIPNPLPKKQPPTYVYLTVPTPDFGRLRDVDAVYTSLADAKQHLVDYLSWLNQHDLSDIKSTARSVRIVDHRRVYVYEAAHYEGHGEPIIYGYVIRHALIGGAHD